MLKALSLQGLCERRRENSLSPSSASCAAVAVWVSSSECSECGRLVYVLCFADAIGLQRV
jgi:hypothetical protein